MLVWGLGVDGLSADGTIPPVITVLAVTSSFQLAVPFIPALKANSMETLEADNQYGRSVSTKH